MKTEILSNEYKNRNRICTQKITYNRYDDIYTLGQYYIKLAETIYGIENGTGNKNQLQEQQKQLEALIEAQHQILKGYEEGDDGTSQGAAERVKADC